MLVNRLRDYLDDQHVGYVSIFHSVAYTAQGVAAVTHISGKELAKTVIVNLDGVAAMAVVPAQAHVDLRLLREVANAKQAELESETEFKGKFPDCETGAMPPFGNLYGMKVFADLRLTLDDDIAFNAGSHREVIRMSWKNYVALVNPVIANSITLRNAAEAA